MGKNKIMATIMAATVVSASVAPSFTGQKAIKLNDEGTKLESGSVFTSAKDNIWIKEQLNNVIKKQNIEIEKENKENKGNKPLKDSLNNNVAIAFQNDIGFMPVKKIYLNSNIDLIGQTIEIINNKGNILATGVDLTKSGENGLYNMEYGMPGNTIPIGPNECHVTYGSAVVTNLLKKPLKFTVDVMPLTYYVQEVQVPKLKVNTEYKYGNGNKIYGTVTTFAGKKGVPTIKICSNVGVGIDFYSMDTSNLGNYITSVKGSLTTASANNQVIVTNPVVKGNHYYQSGIPYDTIADSAFNEPDITVEVKTASSNNYPNGQYVGVDNLLHKIQQISKSNKQDVFQQNIKGVPSSPSNIKQPIIPEGYKISGITVNGKAVKMKENELYSDYKLPAKFLKENQNIVYTIIPVKEIRGDVAVLTATGWKNFKKNNDINSIKDTNILDKSIMKSLASGILGITKITVGNKSVDVNKAISSAKIGRAHV